jgi:hypothetical protein
MAKKISEHGRDEPDQALAGFIVASFSGVEQVVEGIAPGSTKPLAAPVKQLAMPFGELDAGDIQGQPPRSAELFAR